MRKVYHENERLREANDLVDAENNKLAHKGLPLKQHLTKEDLPKTKHKEIYMISGKLLQLKYSTGF